MKINYRPIFYFAVMFVLGLLMAKYFVNISILHIIFVAIIFLFLFFICFKFKYFKRLTILCLAFLIGVFYFIGGANIFMQEDISTLVSVTGRIKSATYYQNYDSYVLDDITISGENKNFCISVMVYGEQDIEVGSVITFSSDLKAVDLFDEDDEYATYYYKLNAPYRCYINFNDITKIESGYLKLGEYVVQSFYDYLLSVCDPDMAGFVTCVIFGDKTNVAPDIESAYLESGMSHLLAVSGMHIVILVAIITYFLNKLKTKKWVNFLIVFFPLMFFVYLCDFAPSVVRAFVMSLVFSFGAVVGKKYDRLNSLAICALIILCVKPMYVFDYGFLLSFLCIFCIFTLTKPCTKMFRKIGAKSLSPALGLTFSVQLGLLPVLMTISSSFNFLSLIINLLCVPIFEFAFVLTLVVVPLCMLLPFLSFLFTFVQFIYFCVSQLAVWTSSLSWAYIPLISFGDIFAISSYTAIFCASGYVKSNIKAKTTYVCMATLFGVIMGGAMLLI